MSERPDLTESWAMLLTALKEAEPALEFCVAFNVAPHRKAHWERRLVAARAAIAFAEAKIPAVLTNPDGADDR